jgi:recombination protein RecA
MAERKSKPPAGKVNNLNALTKFSQEMKRDFENTLYIPGKDAIPTEVKGYVSTGSTILDVIISNRRKGGVPIGRITEISGTESTGKSLLAYHIIKSTQEMGGIPLYIDTEMATDFTLLERLGIDLSEGKFFYAQTNTVESVFQLIESFLDIAKKDGLDDRLITIIWDSVAQTSNEQEVEKDYDQSTMAVNARLIGIGLRKIIPYMSKLQVCMVFINQLKHTMATMPGAKKWTTPGGMAIKYAASVRIELTKDQKITKTLSSGEKEHTGVGANAEIVKNKIAPPFRKCKFNIYFNFGIDDLLSLIPYLEKANVLRKKNKLVYIVTTQSGEEREIKTTGWRQEVRKDKELYSYLKNKAIDAIIQDYDIREDAILPEDEDFDAFEQEDDFEDKSAEEEHKVKKEKKRIDDISKFSAKPDIDDEEES